jgi:hypothetical protein
VPCVFCGGSPTTNEHVFPRRLERFLPEGRRQTIELTRYGTGGYDRSLDAVGLAIRVNRVCATCNNGWMARLEERSIPVLTPLIEGFDGVELLSPRDQRQLALWAVKTAMVTDLTQAQPLLRPDQRRRLRTHGAIPGNARVWIGACDELYPIATAITIRSELQHNLIPGASRIVGFFTPLKIGRLCLYVLFPQTEVVIRQRGRFLLSTARIWPRRYGDLPVPPPLRPATGQAWEIFARAFYDGMLVTDSTDARQRGIRDT